MASILHGTNSLHFEFAVVVIADSLFLALAPQPDDLYAHFRQDGGCMNPSLAKKHCAKNAAKELDINGGYNDT